MSAGTVSVELERSPVGMGIRKVSQWVKYSDFTDSEGATGTLVMTPTIPAGAFVIGTKVYVKTGFTGSGATCTLSAGSAAAGTQYANALNVYTAAKVGTVVTTPLGFIASAQTVYLTATATDWTAVTAGQMFVEIFFLSTEVDLTSGYQDKDNPDL